MTDDQAESIDGVQFDTGISQTGSDIDGARPRRVRAQGRSRRSGGLRRRLVSGFVLLFALAAMGGMYSAFAQASTTEQSAGGDVTAGRQLFMNSCITCHGANLDGVKNRGPALLGVGGAATYFQVATGRMPLVLQGADAERKKTIYTTDQINSLVAYVQSVGGGPSVPTGNLRDMSGLAEGGELFRLNCAACHNFAGRGNSLSAGKNIPSLTESTDAEMYTAMQSGPESMPVFSDNQLTPEQKTEIIAYVQTLKAQADPGGAGLGRVGPISEGIVIWVVGIGAMLLVIMWIGAKA